MRGRRGRHGRRFGGGGEGGRSRRGGGSVLLVILLVVVAAIVLIVVLRDNIGSSTTPTGSTPTAAVNAVRAVYGVSFAP
jgi:hypothetical protein